MRSLLYAIAPIVGKVDRYMILNIGLDNIISRHFPATLSSQIEDTGVQVASKREIVNHIRDIQNRIHFGGLIDLIDIRALNPSV